MVQQAPSGNCQRAPRKYTDFICSIPFQEHFRGGNISFWITEKCLGKIRETVPDRTREREQFPAIVASAGKTKVTCGFRRTLHPLVEVAQKAVRSIVPA